MASKERFQEVVTIGLDVGINSSKLKYKIPMSQKVVDNKNRLFEWYFADKNLQYRYIGSVQGEECMYGE